MLRSTERFLTTHTGSLPRPDELARAMVAKQEGSAADDAALDELVRETIDRVVARQVEAGIDIVNDGEMSKPSYATYVKDRLSGFGGTGNTYVFQDLVGFPAERRARLRRPGAQGAQDAGLQRAGRRARYAIAEDRRGEFERGRRQGGRGASVFRRRLARRDLAVLPQRVLQDRTRSISTPSPRRCGSNTKPSPNAGIDAAARLPRPRHGAARAIRRPQPRGIPASACGCTSRR